MAGFTQVPPQLTRPVWQESWQVPALQTWPEVQAVPEAAPVQVPLAPQWARSVSGSTQPVEHWIMPAGQVPEDTHTPVVQVWPEPQAVPAEAPLQVPLAPQWAGLMRGSMHWPPQLTRPAWQETWHVPPLQTCPEPQTAPADAPLQVPVAPQNPRSVCGSTHLPPQFTRPAWQETWQLPALHTWPDVHAVPADAPLQVPLAPQKARSVAGFTQVPPQLTKPGWQVRAQVPALQTVPAAHVVPQLPQLRLSLPSSTQVPPQATDVPVQVSVLLELLLQPVAHISTNAAITVVAFDMSPLLVDTMAAPQRAVRLIGATLAPGQMDQSEVVPTCPTVSGPF